MTDQDNRHEVYGQDEKSYMHWLYQAVGMGNHGFIKELERAGSPKTIHELVLTGQLSRRLNKRYEKKAVQMEQFTKGYDVTGEYERMLEKGIRFVTVGEEGYPRRLAEISNSPYGIYYVGRMPEEQGRSVAVIGARECSEYGRHMAKLFGEQLAEAGIQVVSGMARGIDGISQKAALGGGGYSLGVLGCGVDICYPRENKGLYEELIDKGGVCSEYPPGIEPRALLFPRRNRIISALSDAVLVIEARERSGTLITVDMALDQGKEVYAVPGRATDLLSDGCNRLIRQGAGLITSPQELLAELSGLGNQTLACHTKQPYRQQELIFLEGRQKELVQMLDYQPQSVQVLQARYEEKYSIHMTIPELLHELLQLCVNGYAKQISGSYFMRSGE